MEDNIDLYWINIIDESMMELFNKYAPEFMFFRHKQKFWGERRKKSDVD